AGAAAQRPLHRCALAAPPLQRRAGAALAHSRLAPSEVGARRCLVPAAVGRAMIDPWVAAAAGSAALAGLGATVLACRWPHRPRLSGLARPSRAGALGLGLSAALAPVAALQPTPLAAGSLALTGAAL